MVSLGWSLRATPDFYVLDHTSIPRISFSSSEFLDESNFITICPDPEKYDERSNARNPDFEFLLSGSNLSNVLPADELFREGKLLPFPQTHRDGKRNTMASKPDQNRARPHEEKRGTIKKEGTGTIWFLDEDPSPRPPRCTVLWKEFLRLKKHSGGCSSSSLSSSSSSSSSAHSVLSGGRERREGSIPASNKGESDRNDVERVIKKGDERRGGRIRIRPVIHVPMCKSGKEHLHVSDFRREEREVVEAKNRGIRGSVNANLHRQ